MPQSYPIPFDYAVLERRILDWSHNQQDILAVLIVGSRARSDPPPDEWSDLDLILFSRHLEVYLNYRSWLPGLGETWLANQGRTGRGDLEWQVVFAGGSKVDFVFSLIPEELGQTPDAASLAAASPYDFVFRRSMRLLYERYPPSTEMLISLENSKPVPFPTEDEFQSLLERLFLTALRVAKNLRRGETWPAFQQCNCSLKELLLSLLEWHARAIGQDPWHEGRCLAQWGEPQIIKDLPRAFSTFEEEDIQRALFSSLDISRRLGQEIAGHKGFAYPEAMDRQITAWLHGILDG